MKKYVLYLTTDGAGTHIMRSVFMELHSKGISSSTIHDDFWKKAYLAISFPNDFVDQEKKVTHLTIFINFAQENGVINFPDTLKKETIFTIFEEIYLKIPEKILFDFSKSFTTEYYERDKLWTFDNVNGCQDLLLDYLFHYPDKKMDILNKIVKKGC